jgi:hypothetical protein
MVEKSNVFLSLMAACCLSLSSSALAIENISNLPKPEEIKNATIGFYGLNVDTYEPITESKIFQSGCVYVTKPNSAQNSDLIKILQDGIKLSDKGPHLFRLRTVILLHLRDNSVFSLKISDAHNKTQGVFGTVDNEQENKQGFLSTDEVMLKALRAWSSKNLEPSNFNSNCKY